MVKASLAVVVLGLLFVRDLRLLVLAGQKRVVMACGVYSGVSAVYAIALVRWMIVAQVQRPDLISLARSVWVGIVCVHLLFGGLIWLISRGGRRGSAWAMVLAPSPATYVCLCLLACVLPDRISGSLGILSLLIFAFTWIALIVPLAYELAIGPLSDRFVSARALRSIALLNLTSVLCLSMVLIEALGGKHR